MINNDGRIFNSLDNIRIFIDETISNIDPEADYRIKASNNETLRIDAITKDGRALKIDMSLTALAKPHKMNKVERHRLILQMLEAEVSLSQVEISKRLNVAQKTISNDIKELKEKGKL